MTDGRFSPMIGGLVFDKDGTLFDFNATWGAWSRLMLVSEARGDPDLLQTLATALGYDLQGDRFRPGSLVIAEPVDIIADTILTVTGQTDRAGLTARMNEAARAVPQQHAADLPALTARLRGMGLTLGVATNDAEKSALRHLSDAGIDKDFVFVAGYDSGHGSKPAPGQLLAFCAQTGLDPTACAMIGDSTHDLAAGRAAGMATVGVLTGPAPRAELATLADAVLDSVADLPDWLASRV